MLYNATTFNHLIGIGEITLFVLLSRPDPTLRRPQRMSRGGPTFNSCSPYVNLSPTTTTTLLLPGMTAAQFNTPTQTASFAQAVQESLTVDADVTNVNATNVVRRRLAHRQLTTGEIDVSYTLQMRIIEGSSPPPGFKHFTRL